VVIKAIMVETVTVTVFTIYFICFFLRMRGVCAEFANIIVCVCTAFMAVFTVVSLITFVTIIDTSQESFHTINDVKVVANFI
jgi:hypothetical protein